MLDIRFRALLPHVYQLEFDNQYDLAMHFLRYQEYYESPVWHKQVFTLVDYMEWYAKEQCGWQHRRKGGPANMFSYPADWNGFNIPRWALEEPMKAIQDWNKYDDFMFTIYKQMVSREGEHPFYLIGTHTQHGETDVLDHEIAHSLYYTRLDYKEMVDLELQNMDQVLRSEVAQILIDLGYAEHVVDDETHAYLATGGFDDMKKLKRWTKLARQPFELLFKETREKCLAQPQ